MNIATITKDRYTVDPLYQWDINQSLEIRGLSLPSTPFIHFTNNDMDHAIVRQSIMNDAGVITVNIPNSLLKKPYKITVYVCVYEGDKTNSLYTITIPVKARNKPNDYIDVSEEEVYSAKVLMEQINDLDRKVDDIVTETDKEFNNVDKAIDILNQKIDNMNTAIGEAFSTVNETLDTIKSDATETDNRVTELGGKIETIEEEITSHTVSIDLSNFETNGQIVETDSRGVTKTTTVEFDESGNPTKITDNDGNETAVTW